MAYNDFSLDKVEKLLEVTLQTVDLFAPLTPLPIPDWLREVLGRGMQLFLLSEKARSEFIVSPILLASRELSRNVITIFSGQRLDVIPEKGLVGECDFSPRRLIGKGPAGPLACPGGSGSYLLNEQ